MNKLSETDFKQAEYLFSNMSFEQQCDIFSSFFSTGNMITRDLNDKLKLINLVCYVAIRMREKDPKMRPIDVLTSITGLNILEPTDNVKEQIQYAIYLKGLSILCDDLLYNVVIVDHLGYSSSDEIVQEILRLINQWMPF